VSAQAAVAAGSRGAAGAAATVLRAGGNAFDAALAAGFAAAVSEPGLSSLGGGGFLLARPVGRDATVLDFFVDAPGRGRASAELEPHFTAVTVGFAGADQVFHVGAGSVAVPGCLPGYLAAHRRWGRLPLQEVVAPAQRLGREGVELEPTQAQVVHLLADVLTLQPEGRRLLAPHGRLPSVGDLVRNPEYADFLDAVADGSIRSFADREPAARVAEAMAGGGLVTQADLRAYAPEERVPLVARYRGHRVVTNPAPSFGGSIVMDALTELDGGGPFDGDGDRVTRTVRALAAATRRQKQRRAGQPSSSRGTTHVSVVDSEGNVAAMTTSNGSCSGVFVAGTGVQLNNVMGESDLHPEGFHVTPPGTRVGSMMAPTLLELRDGRVVALGSGGSERIRSALAQVSINLVDRGLGLDEAVLAPRVHLDGRVVQVEPGQPGGVVDALAAVAPVNVWPGRNLFFGGTHAVVLHPDGRVGAAGDPRRDGAGLVVDL
jgi:gamma-glutamyltranspeptidase / glutathione hydrolase